MLRYTDAAHLFRWVYVVLGHTWFGLVPEQELGVRPDITVISLVPSCLWLSDGMAPIKTDTA